MRSVCTTRDPLCCIAFPAGVKLALLLVAVIGVIALRQPWQLGLAALVIAGLYALARIPLWLEWQQLRPMRWFVLFIGTAQVLLTGVLQATLVCGGLVVSVALAAVVTLTTRVSAMLDLCQAALRPLRRFGVDPDRVALVLALTIRCVPVMVGIVDEVSQARKARGVGFSLVALATPVVLRALRSADEIGDALLARGVDD